MKRMTLKQTLLAVALASCAASTYGATVTNMSVTGGTFNLSGSPGTPNPWTTSSSLNLVGGYGQLGEMFTFFNDPVVGFTGNGTTAPYGGTPVNGGPVPTFNVTGTGSTGTITGKLSAFTINWNGTNFNQGTSAANGTWNPGSGVYNICWSATVVGGPFNGQTGNWSFNGVAMAGSSVPTTGGGGGSTTGTSPIPEASATAMVLVGLALLGGLVTRRRKFF